MRMIGIILGLVIVAEMALEMKMAGTQILTGGARKGGGGV